MYMCVCVCVCMCMCVCMCVCMCMCVSVCLYIHLNVPHSHLVIFSQVELNSNNKMLHAETLFPSFNDMKSAISFFTTLTLSNRSTCLRDKSVFIS